VSWRDNLPPSVVMALGLTGCNLSEPMPEMTPCLSPVVDPCSEDNPPPDCPTPAVPTVPAKDLMDKVRPSVCLSVIRHSPEPDPPSHDCDTLPDHPDCPPADEVKKKVLEDGVLPDDVQEKVQ